MKNRWSSMISISVLLMAALFVLCVLTPKMLCRRVDSKYRAHMETVRKIAFYERTGDPAELRRWIVKPPNESEQILLTVAKWSLCNQTRFINLVSGLTDEERAVFAPAYAAILARNGYDMSFRLGFRRYHTPEAIMIIHCLGTNVTWPQHPPISKTKHLASNLTPYPSEGNLQVSIDKR